MAQKPGRKKKLPCHDELSVNVHEAKTHLSRILKAVETRHHQVTICRDGKVIARLVPALPTKNPLLPHPLLCQVKFLEDPSLPASDTDWPIENR